MTETLMPLTRRKLDAGRSVPLMGGSTTKRERIETSTTPTVNEDVLRCLVLNKERMFMKFDEDIIIGNKAINRQQVLPNIRDMKNIFQNKRLRGTS